MIEINRTQLAGYAVAAVFVVLIGARYLRREPSQTPGSSRATAPSVRLKGAAGGVAVVDVAGAVRRPGVYRLRTGQRIQDAVRRAGGLTSAAAPGGINLAARVADGVQIVVPARTPAGAAPPAGPAATATAPVNLNTATAEQLDGLDGIGPKTAQKILEYRRAHGGFSSLRDLDRIPGIGPKRLAALRGKVVV